MSEYCVCCHLKVAPAAPDRLSREVNGRLVVAHRSCLKGERLESAVSITCRCIEDFGGKDATECRMMLIRASGFEMSVIAMRRVLKMLHQSDTVPCIRRRKAVRVTAKKLERLLLSDFVSWLDTPTRS